MADQSPEPLYVLQLGPNFFLDNNNNFTSKPPPNVLIRDFPIPVSEETRQAVLGRMLAVVPSHPGWRVFLKKIGLDEDSLKYFDKLAGLIDKVVMVVGWFNAVKDVAIWLGFFKGPESMDELMKRLLEPIRRMLAVMRKTDILTVVEGSRTQIISARSRVELSNERMHAGDTSLVGHVLSEESVAHKSFAQALGTRDPARLRNVA